jgi:PAS domain S-box-containing protein
VFILRDPEKGRPPDGLTMKKEPTYDELLKEVRGLRRQMAGLKRVEEELRKSEKRYRMLFNAAQDSVLVLDAEGRIVDVNQGGEQLYGYAPAEMRGRRLVDFMTPDSVPLFRQRFRELRRLETADEQMRIIRKDGRTANIWCKCTPFTDNRGNFEGVLVYDRDITRTKLLQEQLIRSERLAATGQLAASIAHEINSPLQGVIGLIDVMKKSHRDDQKLLKNLILLEGAFDSIRKTVKNLLDLNRPGKQLLQSMDINRVIENTLALVRSNLKKNRIDVRLELASVLPKVNGSPQQISQVLMNLINNAVEAISGVSQNGGGSEFHRVKGGSIVFRTASRNLRVVIEVEDSGPGISKEDLQHVFDPFYTGKKKMGMGVGLSICHGILSEHNGTITASNRPGGGAVFIIDLPATQSAKSAHQSIRWGAR